MTDIESQEVVTTTEIAPRASRPRLTSLARRVSGAITIVRSRATTLLARVPGTITATRSGAHEATSALQTLPDTTLRSLAATSVGLGAGLIVAGAPRLVVAAGVAPAIVMGAAMVLRPADQSILPTTSGPDGASTIQGGTP